MIVNIFFSYFFLLLLWDLPPIIRVDFLDCTAFLFLLVPSFVNAFLFAGLPPTFFLTSISKDAGLIPNKHRTFVMDTQVKYTVVSWECPNMFISSLLASSFQNLIIFKTTHRVNSSIDDLLP